MHQPVSLVIATKDRADKLANLFASLGRAGQWPAEVVVVDASLGGATRELCGNPGEGSGAVVYVRATEAGAGAQRNEGVARSTQEFVLFSDDDVVFEPGCIRALIDALEADAGLGGVSALITNQQYHPLGKISRGFYSWLNGGPMEDFSGRCIGPAAGFLSWDRPGRAEVEPVDWMPTTCAMYRREALPDLPFDPFFKDYSLVEDMAMSLVVARRWKLANVRSARVYHDRVKGEIKSGARRFAIIELVGRHYIMVRVLGKHTAADHARLAAYQLFMLVSLLRTPLGRRQFFPSLLGKLQALPRVIETAWRAGCY